MKYHRFASVFPQCGPMVFHHATPLLSPQRLPGIVFFSSSLLHFLLLFVSTFTTPESFHKYIQSGMITGEAFLDDFTGKSLIMTMPIHRIGNLMDQVFLDSGIG